VKVVPTLRLALDVDLAARLLGEAVDLAEAQARALVDRLGGEERFEDLHQRLGRHAGAVVGDVDGDEGAAGGGMATDGGHAAGVARRDPDRPAARHRVPGVDDHVEDRGVELAGIGLDHVLGLGQVDVSMITDEPIVLPMIRCRPRSRAQTSKTSGCRGWRRAKASSCPVRVAARSAVSAIASM
jgi:hypothetical protein